MQKCKKNKTSSLCGARGRKQEIVARSPINMMNNERLHSCPTSSSCETKGSLRGKDGGMESAWLESWEYDKEREGEPAVLPPTTSHAASSRPLFHTDLLSSSILHLKLDYIHFYMGETLLCRARDLQQSQHHNIKCYSECFQPTSFTHLQYVKA